MAFNDIKDAFIKNEAELEPVVKNALNQLLQKETQISRKISTVENIAEAVKKGNFPAVALSFTSGSENNSRQHLFLMEPAFLSRFYAWMIADEPAQELSDEHFEGLREVFQQVLVQIKLAVPDDQASFTVSEADATLLETAEPLQELLAEEKGLHTVFDFSVEETKSTINYFYWVLTEQENTDTFQPQAQEVDSVTVQPAEFGNLGGAGVESDAPRNVDMLLDVDLEITVELDRKVMMVSELLKLGKGSIVELEKSAGEPLDIFINGRKFAEGEVVVIDDKFGIRITQLLSPKDRLKSLGQ